MIKLCGSNEFSQLGESSTNTNPKSYPIISPPINSHIEVSTLLSLSTYSNHTVWITNDGHAYAIGQTSFKDNDLLHISTTDSVQELILIDSENRPCKFISVVCGLKYTLFIVSVPDDNDKTYLVYLNPTYNNGVPKFLDIDNKRPEYLFGGIENAAAIDTEGGVYIINDSVFSTSSLKATFLPDNEKAVSISFCHDYCIVLSLNGKLFESPIPQLDDLPSFERIEELKKLSIINISGTNQHCFAITRSGKVYGRGSFTDGMLGNDQDTGTTDDFIHIDSFGDYKIISAYAGYNHSLFQTDTGKILACGDNNYGQLLLENGPSSECIKTPIETSINEGASFCIAGNYLSEVFVNCEPPKNCSNCGFKLQVDLTEVEEKTDENDNSEKVSFEEEEDEGEPKTESEEENIEDNKDNEKEEKDSHEIPQNNIKERKVELKDNSQEEDLPESVPSQPLEMFDLSFPDILCQHIKPAKIINLHRTRTLTTSRVYLKPKDVNKNPTLLISKSLNANNDILSLIKIFCIQNQLCSGAIMSPIRLSISPKKEFEAFYQYPVNGPLSNYIGFAHEGLINDSKQLTPTQKSVIAYGIASAIRCIHDEGYSFGEINAKNVYLDSQFRPYLTNFYSIQKVDKSRPLSQKLDILAYSFIYAALIEPIAFDPPVKSTEEFFRNLTDPKLRKRPVCANAEESQMEALEKMWDFIPKDRIDIHAVIEYFDEGDLVFDGTNMSEFTQYKTYLDDFQKEKKPDSQSDEESD